MTRWCSTVLAGNFSKMKNRKNLSAVVGILCDGESNVLYNARMLVDSDMVVQDAAESAIAKRGCAALGCFGQEWHDQSNFRETC